MHPRATLNRLLLPAVLCTAVSLHAQQPGDYGKDPRSEFNGSSRIVVDSSAIRASAARTLAELLAGNVAGLDVTFPSGAPGMAPKLIARGATGMFGPAEPLLYVDGVLWRGDDVWLGPDLGGHAPAFAWTLPVEDIERVEVITGAAGGNLLALGSPRGAVFVTTRRPIHGQTQLTAFADAYVHAVPTRYPANHGTSGSLSGGGETAFCGLSMQALGECTPLVHSRWSPLDQASPFSATFSKRAGAAASGQVSGAQYRAGLGYESGAGLLDNSGLDRVDLAAAVSGQPRDGLVLSADARYADSRGIFPQWEGGSGVLGSGLFGFPHDDPETRGYYTPLSEIALRDIHHTTSRLSMSAGAALRPARQVTSTLRLGFDRMDRRSGRAWISNMEGDPETEEIASINENWTARNIGLSATGDVTVRHRLPAGLSGMAMAGVHIMRLEYTESAGSFYESNWGTSSSSALLRPRLNGTTLFVAERLQWGEHRSLGAGLRAERTSLGGASLTSRTHPSVDASWHVSGESFYPRNALLRDLRLRAAYGGSTEFHSVLAIAVSPLAEFQVGGPTLRRPESTTESELGVHAVLLGGALDVQGAWYRRETRDMPFIAPLPSGTDIVYGLTGDNALTVNGLDLRVALRPVSIGAARWQSAITASFLRTHIERLEGLPFTLSLLNVGPPFWQFESGAPFTAVHDRPYTYSDANEDGIIDQTEVMVAEEGVFLGVTQPRRILGLNSTLSFGNGIVMGALLESKGGHVRFNATEAVRCLLLLCQGLHDPSASLEEQARAVARRYHGTAAGFVENAGFVRLRELWFRLPLPSPLVPPGAQLASFTITGHNLATVTGYSGLDPEIGAFVGAGLALGEYSNQPLERTFTARLDVSW